MKNTLEPSSQSRRVRPLARSLFFLTFLLAVFASCDPESPLTSPDPAAPPADSKPQQPEPQVQPPVNYVGQCRVVHVFVALCDNRHQGIVPVSDLLGHGQDLRNNLYWGAMYGLKTFFKKSPNWLLLDNSSAPDSKIILERLVFRSQFQGQSTYVLADAYDGAHMKRALTDFFTAAAGRSSSEITVRQDHREFRFKAAGSADMVCFVGHNGLMDVRLRKTPKTLEGSNPRWAVVLACNSRKYFSVPLRRAGCSPLLTTTGSMAPEAYTLEAIIRAWASGQSADTIQRRAAESYAEFQHCSLRAASQIFALDY